MRRRVHGRLVGAHVTEQDGAVRQILFHQAGAGRRDRTNDRVGHRGSVDVAAPVEVRVTMAVAVMPVAVPVVVVVMPVVVMTMPVMVVAVMRPVMTMMRPVMTLVGTMMAMTAVIAVTDHLVMTTTGTAAAVTTAVAAVAATSFSTGSDDRREADNGGRDKSEECSTFEHDSGPFGLETFWLEMNHPAQ